MSEQKKGIAQDMWCPMCKDCDDPKCIGTGCAWFVSDLQSGYETGGCAVVFIGVTAKLRLKGQLR